VEPDNMVVVEAAGCDVGHVTLQRGQVFILDADDNAE